jgi:conjugal transfer/entry exclusion protein
MAMIGQGEGTSAALATSQLACLQTLIAASDTAGAHRPKRSPQHTPTLNGASENDRFVTGAANMTDGAQSAFG